LQICQYFLGTKKRGGPLRDLRARAFFFWTLKWIPFQGQGIQLSVFRCPTETPISRPIPYVNAAAIPAKTCRMNGKTPRSVISVIAAPSMRQPSTFILT
jgi:hypothetical protein